MVVGIETDRGPWVAALVAAGYTVYGVNPLQASRYRETARRVRGQERLRRRAHAGRHGADRLPPAAGGGRRQRGRRGGQGAARTHKTLIWERTRQVQRLRHRLREYFPAALEAFEDLDAPDALELLGKAPDPARAAQADPRAGQRRAQARPPPRHPGTGDRDPGRAARRAAGPAAAVTAAYAATVRSLIAVITALNEQVKVMEEQVSGAFSPAPGR